MDWGVSEKSSNIDIFKKINNKLMIKSKPPKASFIIRQIMKIRKVKLSIKNRNLSKEHSDIFVLSPGSYNKKHHDISTTP